MHTTTSWSSPPPAWRVWEAWGRKHNVWSSACRHRVRRAADTRSPVPASYRRRSEGGRETQKQMHVSPTGGSPSAVSRGPRAETQRGYTQRNVGCSRKMQGKNQKVFVVPSHRHWGCCSACGNWCTHIWQQVRVRSAQLHVDAFPTVHTHRQAEQSERHGWAAAGKPFWPLCCWQESKLNCLHFSSQLFLCVWCRDH